MLLKYIVLLLSLYSTGVLTGDRFFFKKNGQN